MRMRSTRVAERCNMSDALKELCGFLSPSAHLDLRTAALDYVLGLTGSAEGLELLSRDAEQVLRRLLELAEDASQPANLCRDAHLALLNASAEPQLAETLVELGVGPRLLDWVVNPDRREADTICKIISNLTRTESGSQAVTRAMATGSSVSLHKLVEIFGLVEHHSSGTNHDYLATVFSNISRLSKARELFLDRERCVVPLLLPHTQSKSLVRRQGIAGLLRNLCFQVDSHQWLLGEEVDILPALLLPLAGPEEFSEEEMEQLPVDLQYLPDDKAREEDPAIRKMLLEAMTKLCSTEAGRSFLREKQVYLILRALDQWERDESVRHCCLELISILIGEEPDDPVMRDLHEVEIPPDVEERLDRLTESEGGGGEKTHNSSDSSSSEVVQTKS